MGQFSGRISGELLEKVATTAKAGMSAGTLVKVTKELTSPRRATQGKNTSAEKTAEMNAGGVFCSGRKVCSIVG